MDWSWIFGGKKEPPTPPVPEPPKQQEENKLNENDIQTSVRRGIYDNNAVRKEIKQVKVEYKDGERELSNQKTKKTVKDLGNNLDADQCIVSGSDRTKEEHEKLRKAGLTDTNYESTQHGSAMGYKAADVKYLKDGKQINTLDVANKAKEMKDIGGIGVYNSFNHIDTRDRKDNGSVYYWDNRTKK